MKNNALVERIRALCIHKGYFTAGTCEQYEKLFNRIENGASIMEIARIIWLCSDDVEYDKIRKDVLLIVKEFHDNGWILCKELVMLNNMDKVIDDVCNDSATCELCLGLSRAMAEQFGFANKSEWTSLK